MKKIKNKEKIFCEKLVISYKKNMKVKIDKDKCLGCGTCVAIAPEVFEIDESGKSKVKEGVDLEKNKDLIIQAKDSCPTQAIEIEE